MLSPLAFLQTGRETISCAEGDLVAAGYPRPGSTAFLAPDFTLSHRQPWWLDVGRSLKSCSRAEWAVRFPPDPTPTAPLAWGAPDEARFAAGFRSLDDLLRTGELRKGVPVTRMSASVPPERAAGVFARLIARVPTLPDGVLAYGFYLPRGFAGANGPEFLVGATPEILFDLQDGRTLTTMAVAGTRPSTEGPEGLRSSPKDRDEHESVIEDLMARLSVWGDVRASPTEVRRFGDLVHLVADIRLESRDPLDFEGIVRQLHPTPALGVYPRNKTGLEWLKQIDPQGDRGRFGAPFGLRLPSGGGRCVVAIRGIQYAAGRLDIWAGCGVVSMSRYEDEWAEVLQKMDAVRTLWDLQA